VSRKVAKKMLAVSKESSKSLNGIIEACEKQRELDRKLKGRR
jgi:hypothetical protein